jgi:hypothetical protein
VAKFILGHISIVRHFLRFADWPRDKEGVPGIFVFPARLRYSSTVASRAANPGETFVAKDQALQDYLASGIFKFHGR